MGKARRITSEPLYLVSQLGKDGEFVGVRGVYSSPEKAFSALEKQAGVREDYEEFLSAVEYDEVYESAVMYGRRSYIVETIYLDLWE